MSNNKIPTTRVSLLNATRNQLLTVLNCITGNGSEYDDSTTTLIRKRLLELECVGIEVETAELKDQTGMYEYIEPIWAAGVSRSYGVAGPV